MADKNHSPWALLLAPKNDPSTKRVQNALLKQQAQVVWLDSRAKKPPIELELTQSGFFKGEVYGHALEKFSGAFVRSIAPRQPQLIRAAQGEILSESEWRSGIIEGNARRDLHTLLLTALKRQPCIILNPPRHGSVLEHKALQLQQAQQLGFKVPHTRFGSNIQLAKKRNQAVLEFIQKPLRGGTVASEIGSFSKEQMLIEQHRIRGADVRIFCLNGVAFLAFSLPEKEHIDYRSHLKYQEGMHKFTSDSRLLEEHAAPTKKLGQKLNLLAKNLALPFMAVDFKKDAQGQLWFLEANGAPVFAAIDDENHGCISQRIAQELLKKPLSP